VSVLVEALTLIVRKDVLDISYPGGEDAFLQAMLDLERPPRFVCNVDQYLINASFHGPAHILPAISLLVEHGLTPMDDDQAYEMVYVDQKFGPTMPCDWLRWGHHEDGFTYAWLVGTDPGVLATPTGWTPEQSRRLIRDDASDEVCGCILVEEDDERAMRIAVNVSDDVLGGLESIIAGLEARKTGEPTVAPSDAACGHQQVDNPPRTPLDATDGHTYTFAP